MRLLLDTHTLLWFLQDDRRLLPRAKALIEDEENRTIVSIASCWEIAVKVGRNKLNLGKPASSFLRRELSADKFDILEIALAHSTFVETLPHHHKDPFDRILIAQAILEAIPIVSADVAFDSYEVTRLWN